MSTNHFSLFLHPFFRQYVNLCVHIWRPSCARITGSLPIPPCKVSNEMVTFLLFSSERAGLIGVPYNTRPCALYHPTLVQFHSSMWSEPIRSHRPDHTLLQGPASHFKLNQVIVQSQYPCPPVAGFQAEPPVPVNVRAGIELGMLI